MSFFISGALLVTAASTVYSNRAAKKSQKKAKKDAEAQAIEDEKKARKAEAFAETEGEGIGELGQVSLEVDDELEEENISSRVRI